MPPFITGISSLNFTTSHSFETTASVDFSTYVETGLRSHHGNSSSYGKTVSSIEYLGNGVVLAGTQNGSHGRIYKSTDHGVTWTTSNTFSNINHVSKIKHLEGDIVLVATGGHGHDGNVYRSVNAGDSWTLVNNWSGGASSGHDNVYSLEYLGNGICLHGGGYNQGDGSVWRSADYGENWTDLRGSNPSGTANTGNVAWDNNSLFDSGSSYYSSTDSWWVLHLKYVGNGVVLANRRATRTPQNSSSTVPDLIRSTDYGINWTKVNTTFLNGGQLITENLGNGRVVGVTNAEGSVSSSNANVYISTDYGATWNTTPKFTVNRNRAYGLTHLGNGRVVFGTFHYNGSGYVTDAGEIYESLDYGETWNSTPVFDPSIMSVMDIKLNYDNNTVYVGGALNTTTPILYKLG